MEKNFNTDNFEQLLREVTDDFRMYPSRRVWHGIYNDLHPAKKWPSFAVLLLLVTSIMYIGVTNPDKGTQTLTQVSSEAGEGNGQSTPGNNAIQTGNIAPSLTVTPTRSSVRSFDAFQEKEGSTSAKPDLYVASLQPDAGAGSQKNVLAGASTVNPNENILVSRTDQAKNVVTSKSGISIITGTTGTENTASANKDNAVTFTSALAYNIPTTTTDEFSSAAVSDIATAKTVNISAAGQNKIMPAVLVSTLDESGWMEDYSFRNLKAKDNWKGRMSYQVYVTPSMGYRSLYKNTQHELPPSNALVANPYAPLATSYSLNHSSAINLEIGSGVIYSASKLLRLKAGVQLNYTNYSIHAQELNHPTFTSLMLTNSFTNGPVLSTRTTTIANTDGTASRYLNNSTYQVSIPLGADIKIAGNDKLKVYVGGTLQPTYIFGGKSYLVSADMKNYVADESFMRKHNLNGAAETFVTYKTKSGVTLSAGPQFRYQFFSTYNKMYTYDEKLYNLGVKLGMTKNF